MFRISPSNTQCQSLQQPMPLSQMPELLLNLAEYLPFEDAACLAGSSMSALRNMEVASSILSSKRFKGVALFGWRAFKGALYQQLHAAMQPQPLLDVGSL